MITRKLGSLLRGNATPFQIVSACVLGALLGFAPAPAAAPALFAILLALLLVTNANLGLALLAAGLARLAALAAAPLSFHIGRWLLDGPTTGLARAAINAPVLAWCGLEIYGVSGGLVLALVLGSSAGFLASRSLTSFRRRMLAATENPTRLNELAARPLARAAIWLFFGKQRKGSWEERLARRVGNPIRVWGAALLVVVFASAAFAHERLASAWARRGLAAGLERANGATVDVGAVELDLAEGRLAVASLAIADPNALERDLLRAERLEVDLDQVSLLRRRFRLARVAVTEATSGELRAAPGALVVPDSEPSPAPEQAPAKGGDLGLEDVFAEAEVWRARLAQARDLLDLLSSDGAGTPAGEAPDGETLEERLAREVAAGGWLAARASHLVDDAPVIRVSALAVDGCTLAFLPGRVFDVAGSELSSQPWLVDAPPRLSVAARDDSIHFEVDLAPASRAGGDGGLSVRWQGLLVDDVMAQLRLAGAPPLSGGTLDVELDGTWSGGRIGAVDLPLVVTLRDTTLRLGGMNPTRLAKLELPIGISGSIDAPRIRFDGAAFARALSDAGKRELAGEVERRLRSELDEALPDDVLDDALGDVELPEVLDGSLGETVEGLGRGLLRGRP